MTRLALFAPLFLFVILAANSAECAGPKTVTWKKWAVIADQPLAEAGLTDLLTAELTEAAGIELVERQELDRIIRELELANYFGAKATRSRLQLGKLTGADALVLLTQVERNKRSFARLLICDCKFGARLAEEYFPFAEQDIDRLAAQCAGAVSQTRERFADGIQRLVAVSPFLSKNLTHDYDHLQDGFAALFTESLVQYRGVAVVEFEEAHSIRGELNLTQKEITDRTVLLFVNGEFVMDGGGVTRKTDPLIHLTLTLDAGEKKRNAVEFREQKLAGVRRILSEEFPQRILKGTANKPATIRRGQQLESLSNRADRFSAVGAFEQAARLREALLLLKPDQLDQRLELLADYRGWNSQLTPRTISSASQFKEANESRLKVQFGIFRRMVPHIRRCVASQKLNPWEAADLVYGASRDLAFHSAGSDQRPAAVAIRELVWSTIEPAFQLDPNIGQGGLRNSISRFNQKGQVVYGTLSSVGPNRQFTVAADRFSYLLLRTIPRLQDGPIGKSKNPRQTFDDLRRMITEIIPTDQLLPSIFREVTTTRSALMKPSREIRGGRHSFDAVDRYFQDLIEHDAPVIAFYGRCGRLALKANSLYGKVGSDDLKELDRLQAFVKEYWDSLNPFGRAAIPSELEKLREPLEARLNPGSAKKTHEVPWNPWPPFDPASRVRFKAVDAEPNVSWRGIIPGPNRHDIVWSLFEVKVESDGGAVTLFAIPHEPVDPHNEFVLIRDPTRQNIVTEVAFDGELVWIGTSQAGIKVRSLDGATSATAAAEHGLPDYERLRLHAIDPGRCLAVGTLGKQKRAWLALLTVGGEEDGTDAIDANIFHTATKVYQGDGQQPESIEQVFKPSFIRTLPSSLLNSPSAKGGSQGQHVLVCRTGSGRERRPLLVDVDNLEVTQFPREFPELRRQRTAALASSWEIVQLEWFGLVIHSLTGNGLDEWERERTFLVPRSATQQSQRLRQGWTASRIVTTANAIYLAGQDLMRVDPKTHKIEKVNVRPIPFAYRFHSYGFSSRYGMVAWNQKRQLFQIEVDPQDKWIPRPIDRCPHVPPEFRQRHYTASQTLAKLGAVVDAVWVPGSFDLGTVADGGHSGSEMYRSHTVVCFPEEWRGSDDDVRHILDLYCPSTILIVGAGIGDEGLRWIGQLADQPKRTNALGQELRYPIRLTLFESNATDAGLKHLGRLQHIRIMHLEGKRGEQKLTDAGLKHLAPLNFNRLTLYGPGFTDEGLKHLSVRQLNKVRLLNTFTTADGWDRLKKRGRFVSIVNK